MTFVAIGALMAQSVRLVTKSSLVLIPFVMGCP